MRVTGDARDFLKALVPRSAGLLITDPPWKLQEIGKGGRFEGAAPYERQSVEEVVSSLAPALSILRQGAHAYIFSPSGPPLADVITGMVNSGWNFRRILGWKKNGPGLGAYMNVWEPVLVFSNGPADNFRLKCHYKSLLEFDRPTGRTAKPWQLYKIFMEMSSDAGDLVIDPYCGTDPLSRACDELEPKRRCLSNDLMSAEKIANQFAGSKDIWKLDNSVIRQEEFF